MDEPRSIASSWQRVLVPITVAVLVIAAGCTVHDDDQSLLPGAVPAQQSDSTEAAIVLSAADHLRRDHTGAAKIEGTSPDAERILMAAEARAQRRGYQVAPRGSTFTCAPRRPDTCRLNGAAVLLSLGEPAIAGDTATVAAEVRWTTGSARQPVAWKRVTVTVVRSNGQWTARSSRLQEIS